MAGLRAAWFDMVDKLRVNRVRIDDGDAIPSRLLFDARAETIVVGAVRTTKKDM